MANIEVKKAVEDMVVENVTLSPTVQEKAIEKVTDLGVTATIIVVGIIVSLLVIRMLINSFDKRMTARDDQHAEERKSWSEKDQQNTERMIRAMEENAKATTSIESLVRNMEERRMRELQQLSSQSARLEGAES